MLKNFERSLTDLLGADYTEAVCRARAFLTGIPYEDLKAVADEKVAFYPEKFACRLETMMQLVGKQVVDPFADTEKGAPAAAYGAAQHTDPAPLSGYGPYRLGEDGRMYFAGKSEHYQLSLGHDFPGYGLIRNAKRLGITNATHNNTRGYVTRLTEKRLIAAANGVSPDDPKLAEIMETVRPGVLNRVINLETGSLAVEAALKMMLARFYSLEGKTQPEYKDRIPVFFVMADNAGGVTGNYHGTTVLAQTLRGLWPDLKNKAEECGAYRVVSVPINDASAFEEAIRLWNVAPYKTAGFCHEIVLMNYGGIRLDEKYLQTCYDLCRDYDTPILCDEIQSCAWYEGGFLFRRYGLKPDFVSVGKGFPGGEYPASKILASAAFDTLSQFGALVTNGQEELASLAYLITMEFLSENGKEIDANGEYYHERLRSLAAENPEHLDGADGDGLMSAMRFSNVDKASAFCGCLNKKYCVDASAQTYKPNCPPVVLTKLPLITTRSMVDALIAMYAQALKDC